MKVRRSHLKGKESPFYKTGIIDFIQYRKDIKKDYCNRCNKNLSNATRYEWCIHHIDHNRSNNEIDNFELLCKRCHQLEHNCVEALKLTYEKKCYMCDTGFTSKANNALYCEVCNKTYRRYKHKYNKEQIKQMIIDNKV